MLDDVGMSSDRNRNRPCAGDGSYEDSTLYLPLLQDSGMTRADSQCCLLYGLGVHGFFPIYLYTNWHCEQNHCAAPSRLCMDFDRIQELPPLTGALVRSQPDEFKASCTV